MEKRTGCGHGPEQVRLHDLFGNALLAQVPPLP